jgi:hypothetical protein
MNFPCRTWTVLLFLLHIVLVMGCGGSDLPELGFVTGKVTMDGAPFSGVVIAFLPDNGRPSTADVDAAGNYELFYKQGLAGTKIGPNTVSFSWPTGSTGVEIPSKYAEKSELKVDVKPGANTFNFDLKSDPSAASRPADAPVIPD